MIFQLVVIGTIAWAVYRWREKSEQRLEKKQTKTKTTQKTSDLQHNWQINVFVVNPDQLKGLLPSKDEKKNEDNNK